VVNQRLMIIGVACTFLVPKYLNGRALRILVSKGELKAKINGRGT